jgi:hypothetical protein
MFRSNPNSSGDRADSGRRDLKPADARRQQGDGTRAGAAPEALHRACWYGRRTDVIPDDIARHTTIEDGCLLFCAHPMWFPIVGYEFDVRNCGQCEYFRPTRARWG